MINVIPTAHQDLAYTIIDGAAIIVSPRDSQLYWLNSVATRIFELADGKNSIEEIARQICGEYEVDHETALRDVGEMVHAFSEKQLFTVVGDSDDE